LSACPALREGILTTTLPGEEVVLSTPDQGDAVILNAVGAAVIDLCDGSRNLDDIAKFLCARFAEAEFERVVSDVESVVRQLSEAGFLRGE